MQAPAGPSGPPVGGPSGPPVVSGPSGPPLTGPSGTSNESGIGNSDTPSAVNPAQFDPLAEIEEARARRKNREESLERLQKRRNSARVNVYLFLALTIVFAGFSFFPVTYGDTDLTAFPVGQNQQQHNQWIDDGNWNEGGYEEKIWDGSDPGSSLKATWEGYIPPPVPDFGSVTSVRIDVEIASYRTTGNTSFTVGIFDGDCKGKWFEDLPEESWHHFNDSVAPGKTVEITLYTQPGEKCFLFEWDERPTAGALPTVDIELAVYWPRILSVPAASITFLLAGFAFIGAQKTGREFKQLKYPEGKPESKVEDEVLEAAEAEQREQIDAVVVEDPENSDSINQPSPNLAQVVSSGDSEPKDEPENSAAAYTDEELLGVGWSQEQIDAMRNS
ncbi:MAG: hypothetical protein QF440_01700 [Candidatus Thalassarchaeaceae archaeon]|nr:hypothetical protein [Candidatus Thalassarchaeaceae archaeon]